jgi:hypothetical protein
MKLRGVTIFVFFLTLFLSDQSNAGPIGCAFRVLGGDYAILTMPSASHRRYSVSSTQPKWATWANDYHAETIIGCEGCVTGKGIYGRIWLRHLKEPLEKPDLIELQRKLNSSPQWLSLGETPYSGASVRGAVKPVEIGLLSGWLTRFTASGTSKDGSQVDHDVVEVKATDGCGMIDIRIETTPSGTYEPIAEVMELISAIQVTRSEFSNQELNRLLNYGNVTVPVKP